MFELNIVYKEENCLFRVNRKLKERESYTVISFRTKLNKLSKNKASKVLRILKKKKRKSFVLLLIFFISHWIWNIISFKSLSNYLAFLKINRN